MPEDQLPDEDLAQLDSLQLELGIEAARPWKDNLPTKGERESLKQIILKAQQGICQFLRLKGRTPVKVPREVGGPSYAAFRVEYLGSKSLGRSYTAYQYRIVSAVPLTAEQGNLVYSLGLFENGQEFALTSSLETAKVAQKENYQAYYRYDVETRVDSSG